MRELSRLIMLLIVAVSFGSWQKSISAGIFMFVALDAILVVIENRKIP